MNAVYREYLAATVAADVLRDRLRHDPGLLEENELRARDFGNFRDHLAGTYLIRLFSEFEAGLRDLWAGGFRQSTSPPMRDLLPAIAARRLIHEDVFAGADGVRTYRNFLVHEVDDEAEVLTVRESRQRLSRYFSFLPLTW